MNKHTTKGRVPVILAIVTVALGAIGLARRCAQPDSDVVRTYDKPSGDTLAVAIEMSPLTYTLCNDTAEGFDYQILKDLAAGHGFTVEFFPVAVPDDAFLGLYRHKYDLYVGSVPSTVALKRYFPLTDAVYFDKQVLVQRAGSGDSARITSQEQLIGDTVWVTEGSPFKTRLRNMSHELGDTIYIETSPDYSSEQLAILTALGEVKQAIVGEAVARRIAAEYPNLNVTTPISLSQNQCWALAPGDSARLDSLNAWLKSYRTTDAYRALAKKYGVE